MSEAGETEPKVKALVGGYKVVEDSGSARLVNNEAADGQYPDASSLVFDSPVPATEVAQLLSRFCAKDSNKHPSEYPIGKVLKVSVSGGENATCGLYRLDPETGKAEKGPFLVTSSPQELVNNLQPFFGRKK